MFFLLRNRLFLKFLRLVKIIKDNLFIIFKITSEKFLFFSYSNLLLIFTENILKISII